MELGGRLLDSKTTNEIGREMSVSTIWTTDQNTVVLTFWSPEFELRGNPML